MAIALEDPRFSRFGVGAPPFTPTNAPVINPTVPSDRYGIGAPVPVAGNSEMDALSGMAARLRGSQITPEQKQGQMQDARSNALITAGLGMIGASDRGFSGIGVGGVMGMRQFLDEKQKVLDNERQQLMDAFNTTSTVASSKSGLAKARAEQMAAMFDRRLKALDMERKDIADQRKSEYMKERLRIEQIKARNKALGIDKATDQDKLFAKAREAAQQIPALKALYANGQDKVAELITYRLLKSGVEPDLWNEGADYLRNQYEALGIKALEDQEFDDDITLDEDLLGLTK